MLQLSAETRIGLHFEFHPDIAIANFGGDLRNFDWHRTKLRPWKTVEPHSCCLSRLDPANAALAENSAATISRPEGTMEASLSPGCTTAPVRRIVVSPMRPSTGARTSLRSIS